MLTYEKALTQYSMIKCPKPALFLRKLKKPQKLNSEAFIETLGKSYFVIIFIDKLIGGKGKVIVGAYIYPFFIFFPPFHLY